MRKTKRNYGCPVEFSIELLSGKWKTVILSRLKLRPMRYGELRHDIPALSDKILTERLRDLCASGFVERQRSGRESRYRLTRRGEMLKPMLQALYDWGETNAVSFDVGFPKPDSARLVQATALAAARPALRPENRQPPRKVPSSDR